MTVGVREYARQRGVSAEAVSKAIKAGRLAQSVTFDGKGRPKIDPAVADGEWDAFTSPTHGGIRHAKPKDDDEPLKPSGNAAATFAQSRAVKEAYLARLAKLEFEEKSGRLVSADGVKSEAFRTARMVRDGLLNIADRISAELAAESDPFVVHKKLTEEIRKALTTALGNE